MKANFNLSKKVLSNTVIGLAFFSLIFVQCAEDRLVIEPEIESSVSDSVYLKSTAYSIVITPSKNPVKVGDCLYFTGTVTQGGKPVSGLNIGVEDPIKQQSIPQAATTDSKGKFTYNIETMCPAMYNDMVGTFNFKFFVGNSTLVSKVTVQVNSAYGSHAFTAVNTSSKTYKVQPNINGVNQSMITVGPGKTYTLWSSEKYGNVKFAATVFSTDMKVLWKAVLENTMKNSSQNSTFVNPTYTNYKVNSSTTLNGKVTNRTLTGVGQFYRDWFNKEMTVGTVKVKAEQELIHGVATKQELGMNSLSCKTFLGAKIGCRASCGASAGLQICGVLGEPWALTPATAGCSVKCCVEIATVKCELGSVGFSASAMYK